MDFNLEKYNICMISYLVGIIWVSLYIRYYSILGMYVGLFGFVEFMEWRGREIIDKWMRWKIIILSYIGIIFMVIKKYLFKFYF